jgi:hypothetical protein
MPYHFTKGMVCQFLNGKICPPATSEAGATGGQIDSGNNIMPDRKFVNYEISCFVT